MARKNQAEELPTLVGAEGGDPVVGGDTLFGADDNAKVADQRSEWRPRPRASAIRISSVKDNISQATIRIQDVQSVEHYPGRGTTINFRSGLQQAFNDHRAKGIYDAISNAIVDDEDEDVIEVGDGNVKLVPAGTRQLQELPPDSVVKVNAPPPPAAQAAAGVAPDKT